MDAPGISVVIPTGSVDADLLTQLRAVTAQQSDVPFEVVVSLNTPDPSARTALDAMLAELGDDDPELAHAIADFQADEVEHRDAAFAAGAERAPAYPLLSAAIRLGCRVAIATAKRL